MAWHLECGALQFDLLQIPCGCLVALGEVSNPEFLREGAGREEVGGHEVRGGG